jgi:hypothetical protein
MAENLDLINLKIGQMNQVMQEYRTNSYNHELKSALLIKLLEEKGVLSKGELDSRWPLFLKNEVGVLENDGVMAGTLKVTFY